MFPYVFADGPDIFPSSFLIRCLELVRFCSLSKNCLLQPRKLSIARAGFGFVPHIGAPSLLPSLQLKVFQFIVRCAPFLSLRFVWACLTFPRTSVGRLPPFSIPLRNVYLNALRCLVDPRSHPPPSSGSLYRCYVISHPQDISVPALSQGQGRLRAVPGHVSLLRFLPGREVRLFRLSLWFQGYFFSDTRF